MANWQAVKELFHKISTLKDAEREAYLAVAAESSPEEARLARELWAHHREGTWTGMGWLPTPATRRSKPTAVPGHVRRWIPFGLAALALALGALMSLAVRARIAAGAEGLVWDSLRVLNESQIRALEFQLEEWRAEAIQIAARHEREIVSWEGKLTGVDRQRVARKMGRLIRSERFEAWALFDVSGLVLVSSREDAVGVTRASRTAMGLLARGEAVAFFSGRERLAAGWPGEGELRTDVHLLVPLRRPGQPVRAMLGLVRPMKNLRSLVESARFGASGEVVLFQSDGLALVPPRFSAELVRRGLVPAAPGIPAVYLRDPGVPLHRLPPGQDPALWPPTFPMRLVTSQIGGPFEDHGAGRYRGYRGEEVLAAGRWLPQFGVGMLAKVDEAEILAPLRLLPWVVLSLMALSVGGAALFYFVARPRPSRSGDSFGPYTLLEKIGEGGVGEIYLAGHERLQRPAAIKILRRDRATPEAVERFTREVEVVSQLRHPNTVEIYDYGETPQGDPYCAMEYLRGFDLEEWVRRAGPLAPGRVRHIAMQICRSMREAHDAGFLHRDLKPANVMLCEMGGEFDIVKLVDFGLAQPITAPGNTLDGAGGVSGTPFYVAPERLDGRKIDARSDLFSLGVLLYFLLSGKRPYGDEGADWVAATVTARLIPLAERGIAVPAEFERLLERCLERDARLRPASAREVLEMLDGLETSLPWTAANQESAWRPFSATAAA